MLQLRHHRKADYSSSRIIVCCCRFRIKTALPPEDIHAPFRTSYFFLMNMHKKERNPYRFTGSFPFYLYIGPVRLPICSSSIAPEALFVVLTGEEVVTLLLPVVFVGPEICVVVSYCDTPPGPAFVLVPGSLVVTFDVLLPPGVVAVTALLPVLLTVVLPPPAWVTETLPIAEVQAPFASKL